jgi:hypothetical protein
VYSVFHYFPTYEYAIQALRELVRVCQKNGRIWIGDIPDKNKQQEALIHRAQLMQQNVPIWPWPDVGPLEQRFYNREFFIDFCERIDLQYRFVVQSVEGYLQGRYRYNLYIEK